MDARIPSDNFRRLTPAEMASVYPTADIRSAIAVLLLNPSVSSAEIARVLELQRGNQPAQIFVRAILKNLGGAE